MNQQETQKERQRQIARLMQESGPEEQARIAKARRQGRQLRRRVERLKEWKP